MNAEQAKKLREPFKPEQMGKLPKPTSRENKKGSCQECGGYHGLPAVHLDYVGHAAVTDRLLQVDPDWTWEPMAYGPNGEPLLTNGGLWIKLTVCGVTRPGFGDEGNGKGMKEIIGDAIRNAAMRFGVALDLWSKEDLKDSAGGPESPNAPGDAAATQGQAVSQADGPQPNEPAPPAEETFPVPKGPRGGGKPSKAKLAELTELVDGLLLDEHITLQQIAAAAGGEWPAIAETLNSGAVTDLIGRLTRYRENVKAAA